MLMNLILGLATMLLCLLLQALLLVVVLRYYLRKTYRLSNPSFWSSLLIIMAVMVLLMIGNLAQIGIWALLFRLAGEFEVFSEAFYHSAVNFATLGYGDFVMSAKHKLLGPLEAINGVLMIGVSTAVLTFAFQNVIKIKLQSLNKLSH